MFTNLAYDNGMTKSPSNEQALSQHFSNWMRDGNTTRSEINHMIETYWANPDLRAPNLVPWKDFLTKRVALTGQDRMDHAHDPDYWKP